MFSHATPLHAAAAIDADWTERLIDDLFDNHLHEYDSRKLAVLSGVIASLVE